MRSMIKTLLIWAVWLLVAPPLWAAQTVNGNLTGTFTGSATDGSGSYSGNIDGTWTATGTFDATGNFVENVTGDGTFGGEGIAGTWLMSGYNSSTKTISVSWAAPNNRGPSGGTADGAVSLVVDTATGIAEGTFTGQFFTAAGTKTINGTWTVLFQGAPASVVTGQIQGSLNGNVAYLGAITGSVDGTWRVSFMTDGSVTGSASGSYDGGTYATDYGSVCVCGNWIAAISRGADGQYRLEGSWTHPDISGTLSGSGGGPIVWYIDTSTNPIQASGNFSGSNSFSIVMGPAGTPPTSVPVSVSGRWTATLPIDP